MADPFSGSDLHSTWVQTLWRKLFGNWLWAKVFGSSDAQDLVLRIRVELVCLTWI